jgi:hypothetical protein
MEATYALLDDKGIILNIILVEKDDFQSLENSKEAAGAASYREIDLELIIGRVGSVYWNGIHWDRVVE